MEQKESQLKDYLSQTTSGTNKLLDELIMEMLIYYRNKNRQAEWLDISKLPKFLGDDVVERLRRWKEYKDQGIMLIDSNA